MFIRETGRTRGKESSGSVDAARDRSPALYTESIVSLLSSPTIHCAMTDLVSLIGQTFPQAAPAVYVGMSGSPGQAYSVLDRDQAGPEEAGRILGNNAFSLVPVPVGGRPPLLGRRIDMKLVDTPSVKVTLSISSGIHDGIFRDWVKILTPVVTKIMDHEVLLHMAYRDGLTGLFNYRAFDEMLRAEHDRAKRYHTAFSVMLIDIDWFKRINDGFGHQVGDMVLKAFSDVLSRCVRKSDRVFRYGGEEFAVVLPHAGIDKARKLAERLREIVEKTEFIAGLHITVSIGISEYTERIAPFDLVRQVDKGLYLAKERGRNRVEAVKGIS